MPTYVRNRVLSAKAFVAGELERLRDEHQAYNTDVIYALRDTIPFTHFVFSGLDIDGCGTGTNTILLTDMPIEMLRDYAEIRGGAPSPFLARLTPETSVASWHDFSDDEKHSAAGKALGMLTQLYGVAPMTAFGLYREKQIYGVAAFSRNHPFTNSELRVLQWFSKQFHDMLSEPILLAFNDRLGISEGERLCLEYVSRGLTSEEIAKKSDFTIETVNSYLKSVIRKIGAKNRQQAVADALRLRLIA